MATASTAVRNLKLVSIENVGLKTELGKAKNIKTLRGWKKEFPQLDLLGNTDSVRGRRLSDYCKLWGYERVKIENTSYGFVWGYPRELVERVVAEL